jgi:hypothetical protein
MGGVIINSTCVVWLSKVHAWRDYQQYMRSVIINSTRVVWLSTVHAWCDCQQYMRGVIINSTCMVWLSTVHAWCDCQHYISGVIINSTCVVWLSTILKAKIFLEIVEHSVRTAQWTLSISLIETNQLMSYKEMIAVYSFYAVKLSRVKKYRNSNS